MSNDRIGRYHPGCFFSESFAGAVYDHDLVALTGVGRNDGTSLYSDTPGGPAKTLRKVIFLHETSHFVHDLSLGAAIEVDFIRDSALAILLSHIGDLSNRKSIDCPILSAEASGDGWHCSPSAEKVQAIAQHFELIASLLEPRNEVLEFATQLNPAFVRFEVELRQLSGLAIMEGLVAAKTLFAMALRCSSVDDVDYLHEIKSDSLLLPESLSAIYTTARTIYDSTVGRLLGMGMAYHGDAWPRDYVNSPRAISDEGFVYLADLSLHIPPMEYIFQRIREGKNVWGDFMPAYRFVAALHAIMQTGFPPQEHPESPNLFYATVFDHVAEFMGWPSYEETNLTWMSKLATMKGVRGEAADGYRFRMIVQKNQRPSDIVLADCVAACLGQFVPLYHLTPTGLKSIQGYVLGDRVYLGLLEMPDFLPYASLTTRLPLWSDLPRTAAVQDLGTETGNQALFRQEIVYRLISSELMDAILFREEFACPFAGFGCEVATETCKHLKRLDQVPKQQCCLRAYAEAKQIDLGCIRWKN